MTPVTIGEVIKHLLDGAALVEGGVDGVVAGPGSGWGEADANTDTDAARAGTFNASTAVTGVAVVFTATQALLEQAAALGVNLVISHEGLFYCHREAGAAWLPDDPVVRAKRELLGRTGMTVVRYHDRPHRCQPDAITAGLIEALAWAPHLLAHEPAAAVVEIEPMTLAQVARHVKAKLGIPYVRAAGNPDMLCRRIGVAAGYRGGAGVAVPLIQAHGLDLVIAGEGPEWETPEYVRDAAREGRPLAYLALGHAESEEPGMRAIAAWLRERFPGVPVHALREAPLFRVL
ncbi:Nif3-like dinuclear metal center hexameric protein [Paenibacillus oryzisoli]|uniref:Nif3-like dinuclear metal center hexameric protein n=1 Tax=Paenibacillus oryzisoli TaxID=1850517 RepID=UPI003D2B1D46